MSKEALPPPTDSLEVLTQLDAAFSPPAVFIPIVPGTKQPARGAAWGKVTLEESQSVTWRGRFTKSSGIAIKLGQISGNLVDIEFDSITSYLKFIDAQDTPGKEESLDPADNWVLRTLTTKGQRAGGHIWVRFPNGEFPTKSVSHPGLYEWRADGTISMIHGLHESRACYYERFGADAPTVINYADIKWPEGWPRPEDIKEYDGLFGAGFEELIEECGAPCSTRIDEETGERSISGINPLFWARRFMIECPVLYVSEEQQLYSYERAGKHHGLWVRRDGEVLLMLVWDYLIKIAIGKGDGLKMEFPMLFYQITEKSVSAVVRLVRSGARTSGHKWPTNLIGCSNGVVVLEAGTFHLAEFAPHRFLRHKLPIEFDPKARCPQFQSFLTGGLKDPDDIFLLRLKMGSIIGGTNHDQRAIIIHGPSESGKTTLTNTLIGMVGRENMAELRPDHLAGQFEMAFYGSAKLLSCPEAPPDFFRHENTETIKSLTGGEQKMTEVKGSSTPGSLVGAYNLCITTNNILSLPASDQGSLQRRFVVLEFNCPIPSRTQNYAQVLLDSEGSGILNYALDGYVDYMGYLNRSKPQPGWSVSKPGDLPMSKNQVARVAKLLSAFKSLEKFVQEQMEPAEDGEIPTSEVVDRFTAYQEDNDEEPMRMGKVQRHLPDYMQRIHKAHQTKLGTSRTRGYKGVRWVA